MKISFEWLNQYVDLEDFRSHPEELDHRLTQAGLEVESIENQSSAFKHITLGQIIEMKAHSNADKLTVCQVDVGDKQGLKQIVCGAKNHQEKDFVIVAQPGAVLPGNFEIKKSKIRGVASLGMLCSASELGLESGKSSGIMILKDEATPITVGDSFAKWAELEDIIFEISVTPNRADCLSHYGLARELACLLDRPCRAPKVFQGLKKKGDESGGIKVELTDSISCPRYTGCAVEGIKVGSSPAWIKKRLESVGMNSINNIVDITNFVMLELGQPMHAFDKAEINQAKIQIDRSVEKEKFITLDGSEIALTGKELVIRDGSRPVALAGVVGGQNSGISGKTTAIFFESAYFLNDTVRKTSRHFGIETDSAYRFSRGTDPEGVLLALKRACFLLGQEFGGEISTTYIDKYPEPIKRSPITVRQSYVEDRLGYKIVAADFETWMARLGCEVNAQSKGGWNIEAPPFRIDLSQEVDLVEEFARLNGYDKIPEVLPPLLSEPTNHDAVFLNERSLVGHLAAEGYNEIVSYNFVGEQFQRDLLGEILALKECGLEPWEESVRIKNPLNEETNAMRLSLAPGLLLNALHNHRHGTHVGRTFEIGSCFGMDENNYAETQRLGMMAWGQSEGLWAKESSRPTIYDLKSNFENIIKKLFIGAPIWRPLKNPPSFLHPKQCVGVFLEGKMLGYLGSLHPQIREKNKIRCDIALCEVQVTQLMQRQPRTPKLKSISKYPSVECDLAFLIPDSLPTGDVLRELQKQGGGELKKVTVFDIFTGGNVPDGHRSVAFKMNFQHQNKTVEEGFIAETLKKTITKVEQKFKIQVR